jgi:hypothetical protein
MMRPSALITTKASWVVTPNFLHASPLSSARLGRPVMPVFAATFSSQRRYRQPRHPDNVDLAREVAL